MRRELRSLYIDSCGLLCSEGFCLEVNRSRHQLLGTVNTQIQDKTISTSSIGQRDFLGLDFGSLETYFF